MIAAFQFSSSLFLFFLSRHFTFSHILSFSRYFFDRCFHFFISLLQLLLAEIRSLHASSIADTFILVFSFFDFLCFLLRFSSITPPLSSFHFHDIFFFIFSFLLFFSSRIHFFIDINNTFLQSASSHFHTEFHIVFLSSWYFFIRHVYFHISLLSEHFQPSFSHSGLSLASGNVILFIASSALRRRHSLSSLIGLHSLL